MTAPWRRRLSELGRGVGKPHAPLFAPLLYGVAAQIEALPPAEVAADPTRLAKCVGELRRVLGTESLVVAAPTAMEAEALGAEVDRERWPPRVTGAAAAGLVETTGFDELWSRSEALAASLECCKRLAATQAGESALLAALTGPATLLAQLLGEGATTTEAWEFAGRALSALSRQFAQRGVSGILLCERGVPGDADVGAWGAALNTIANIARFHRIPALLAFDGADPAEWPAATISCPSRINEGAVLKTHGMTAPHDPASWNSLIGSCGNARVVVTAREVDADFDVETLRERCEAALAIQDEPA